MGENLKNVWWGKRYQVFEMSLYKPDSFVEAVMEWKQFIESKTEFEMLEKTTNNATKLTYYIIPGKIY